MNLLVVCYLLRICLFNSHCIQVYQYAEAGSRGAGGNFRIGSTDIGSSHWNAAGGRRGLASGKKPEPPTYGVFAIKSCVQQVEKRLSRQNSGGSEQNPGNLLGSEGKSAVSRNKERVFCSDVGAQADRPGLHPHRPADIDRDAGGTGLPTSAVRIGTLQAGGGRLASGKKPEPPTYGVFAIKSCVQQVEKRLSRQNSGGSEQNPGNLLGSEGKSAVSRNKERVFCSDVGAQADRPGLHPHRPADIDRDAGGTGLPTSAVRK